MNFVTQNRWPPQDYCVRPTNAVIDELPATLAADVYDRVLRTTFNNPGFCLIDLGPHESSPSLRRLMVSLKRELRRIHQARMSRDLTLMSLARFDQQTSTKPHRDGGPDESFLLLGYEPTGIRSEMAISDYSKCAYDLGLTPAEFLERHNPMFRPGQELLLPYTTPVACFSHRSFQVLLINNSQAAFCNRGDSWQGVLHTATIFNPSDDLQRVVNSMMVASAPLGTGDVVSNREQEEFVRTATVQRRGYDKPHLKDE